MPRCRVMADDNYHYMDESERYEHGTYDTVDEALAVCRAIVEQSLKHGFTPGMTAEALYQGYVGFGDDPFIVVIDSTISLTGNTVDKAQAPFRGDNKAPQSIQPKKSSCARSSSETSRQNSAVAAGRLSPAGRGSIASDCHSREGGNPVIQAVEAIDIAQCLLGSRLRGDDAAAGVNCRI